MCGILIYIDKNKKISNFDLKKLKKATKLLYHRGPDFQKTIVNKNIFLFHSRLSIQDLNSRSNQPMIKKVNKKKYIILYNGEIYNFKKIKKKLIKKISFKTKSDTEVLLNNFIINKNNNQFYFENRGMFAYAIFQNNDVFLARDFFGQKPLYYFKDNNKIIISSEIKPILNLINKKKINYEAVNDYFLNNDYFAKKSTFFDGIKQLLPGEVATIQNNEIYFEKIYKSIINTKKKKTKKTFLKFFEKNIIDHTISDKKIALSLSSGIDSSVIAHVIYKYSKIKYDLTAYTFDFENCDYEFKKAENFVKAYNQKIKKVIISENYIINNFENFFKKNEGPLGGVAQFGLFKICELAKRDGFDVMLSGYGLDECFGSYKNIRINNNIEKSFKLIDDTYLNNNCLIKSKNIIDKIEKYFFEIKIPRTTHFVDRASMSSSVEMRIPFLENKFVEEAVKFNDNNAKIDKYIIREYMQKNSQYKKNWMKPKEHVPHPQNKWLRRGSLSEWTESIIKENIIYNQTNIKKNLVLDQWKKFKDKKIQNGYVFWQLLNLYFLFKLK